MPLLIPAITFIFGMASALLKVETLPFGITLFALAFHDGLLLDLASRVEGCEDGGEGNYAT